MLSTGVRSDKNVGSGGCFLPLECPCRDSQVERKVNIWGGEKKKKKEQRKVEGIEGFLLRTAQGDRKIGTHQSQYLIRIFSIS